MADFSSLNKATVKAIGEGFEINLRGSSDGIIVQLYREGMVHEREVKRVHVQDSPIDLLGAYVNSMMGEWEEKAQKVYWP